jgi:hypothetical protein
VSEQAARESTDDILSANRAKKMSWQEYETSFLAILQSREVDKCLSPQMLADACLPCSEATPHRCDRRSKIRAAMSSARA